MYVLLGVYARKIFLFMICHTFFSLLRDVFLCLGKLWIIPCQFNQPNKVGCLDLAEIFGWSTPIGCATIILDTFGDLEKNFDNLAGEGRFCLPHLCRCKEIRLELMALKPRFRIHLLKLILLYSNRYVYWFYCVISLSSLIHFNFYRHRRTKKKKNIWLWV